VVCVHVYNSAVVYDSLIEEGYCTLLEIYPCRSRARLGRCEK